MKKEPEESITNGKKKEKTDMQEKVNKCTTDEEGSVKVVQWSYTQELREIIKNK